MMKKFCTLAAVAVLTLGVTACDEKTETKVEERAVVNGTEVETSTTRTTTVDDHGNATTHIESERTVDPEGLMNKQTTEHEFEAETEQSR